MLRYLSLLNRYEDNLQEIYLISLTACQVFANSSCLTFPKIYRLWTSRTVQLPLCALACQARPTGPASKLKLELGVREERALCSAAACKPDQFPRCCEPQKSALAPAAALPFQACLCARSKLCCCLHGCEEKFKRNSGKRNVYRGEFFFSSLQIFVILLKRTALNIKCFMAQKLFMS